MGSGPTFAERQLQQQRQDNRRQQQQRELAEASRKTNELREENRRLLKQIAASNNKNNDDEGGDEMDGVEGPSPLTDEQRQQQIASVKASMPYLESHYGKESEEYARASTELETLQRASRDSKPYKTHRAYLERRLEKLRRQQDTDKAKADDTEKQIEILQNTLGEVREAIQERDKSIGATEAELKELLRSAIGEDCDNNDADAAADVATSWNKVVATASSLAGRPGVPADWASQLQGLFQQLQSVVVAMEGAAAAHDVAGQAAHEQQMRQQQIEQQQLQAQLTQQQQKLAQQTHGMQTACQPHPHADVPPPATPILLDQALPPPAPASSPQTSASSTTAPFSAEDMVARAMLLGRGSGSAAGDDNDAQPAPPPPAPAAPAGAQAPAAGTTPPSSTTTRGAAEAGEISENELPSSDDDDMEVQIREGESAEQHSSRIKKLLREKLQRARERKGERKNPKCKDPKESTKEKPRSKASTKT